MVTLWLHHEHGCFIHDCPGANKEEAAQIGHKIMRDGYLKDNTIYTIHHIYIHEEIPRDDPMYDFILED